MWRMLRLSNGSIYLALAVLAILIRCAAAAVVATAARCALASGAALMAPPLRARRSCRRRRRRRCYRHRVRWSLLVLVTRDPGDLALLALRVVAAAAAAPHHGWTAHHRLGIPTRSLLRTPTSYTTCYDSTLALP